MKWGSMTVLGNTIQKHLTATAVRSCNLFKQNRKIQMHKTELATMEFHHLHLSFCKTGFILTTEGQISQYLVALNLSVSSDFSCEQSFSKEACFKTLLILGCSMLWQHQAAQHQVENKMCNYLWKYSITLQAWICPEAAIPAATCIFQSLLENCQRRTFTNNLANPRLPNTREAALPSCPTSISAFSSAAPASAWPHRSTCRFG